MERLVRQMCLILLSFVHREVPEQNMQAAQTKSASCYVCKESVDCMLLNCFLQSEKLSDLSRTKSIEEHLIQKREQDLLASPLLLSSTSDPLRRQDKAKVTRIRELDGVRKVCTTNSV